MIKFTCIEFEIDLTNHGLSFIKENFWFKDSLFSEYSLPTTIVMSDEMKAKMHFQFHPATQIRTIFEGHLMRGSRLDPAVLEINSIKGRDLKINIKVQSDKISTWDRKLSTLPLQAFELQNETITQHAASVITKQYPDTMYNFPMVYLSRYDTSDATFASFKSFLNYYENGAFLDNNIDSNTGTINNYNIMQPMPYLLHVLTEGFNSANLELKGDILTDPEVKKALITAVVDYFNTSSQQEIEAFANYDDFYEIYQHTYDGHTWSMAKYFLERDITEVGEYRIVGDIDVNFAYMANEKLIIKYGDEILYQSIWDGYSHGDLNAPVSIDTTFIVSTLDIAAGKKITIYVEDNYTGLTGRKIDLHINPIRYHNVSGDAANVIYLSNEINLKKSVPDMKFGDLVKAVMNWKNFDFDVQGDTIYMNYIKNQINRQDAINLQRFNTMEPLVKFNKNLSFELSFIDDDKIPDFKSKRIFIDRNGYSTDNYEKFPDTKEIKINLLPLPKITVGNITTAYLTAEEKDHLYLTFYDGPQNNLPVAVQMPNAVFPGVYNTYLADWFNFRLNTNTFIWQFIIPTWLSDDISTKHLVYAYDNYFVVKKIEQHDESVSDVTIKIEADKLL